MCLPNIGYFVRELPNKWFMVYENDYMPRNVAAFRTEKDANEAAIILTNCLFEALNLIVGVPIRDIKEKTAHIWAACPYFHS